MSYYQTQNNKQRSIGFVAVIILHIVLIYVLVSCLTIIDRHKKAEGVKAKVVEIIPPKVELPPPTEPSEIKTLTPDFTPTPVLDFEVDTSGSANVITQVQHVEEKPIAVESAIVKAKRSSKGLTHPKYPKDAARLGEEGTTEMNLNIAENGSVVKAVVISSSGSASLDEAIVSHALSYWKFTPCMDGDRPVACWHPFSFQWHIENAKKSDTWRSVVAAKNE